MLSPSIAAFSTGYAAQRVDRGLQDERQVRELARRAPRRRPCTCRAGGRSRVMSISNTVVTWAEVRFESTMCSAVLLADRRHRARPRRAGPRRGAGEGAAARARRASARRRGCGAAAGAGGAAAGGAAGAERPSRWPRMSCFVTRPPMPVPGISRMSTLCSAAILRTTGDERVWRSSSAVISARVFSRRSVPASARPRAGTEGGAGARLRRRHRASAAAGPVPPAGAGGGGAGDAARERGGGAGGAGAARSAERMAGSVAAGAARLRRTAHAARRGSGGAVAAARPPRRSRPRPC